MFNKELIESLKQRIDFIENRLIDIENPFRFNLGDKITATYKPKAGNDSLEFTYTGIIVDRSYKHESIIFMYGYPAKKKRVNYYKVYVNSNKKSFDVNDEYFNIEMK